jgi:hypothetical protein
MSQSDYNQEGDVAEAEAIAALRRRGYVVSLPFGGSAVYDLIAEKDGCIKTIQVKSSTDMRDNRCKFYLMNSTDGGEYGERVDVFVLYSSRHDKLFAIDRADAPATFLTVVPDVERRAVKGGGHGQSVSLDAVF